MNMPKKTRKRTRLATNKGKFSIYVDRDVMAEASKRAAIIDRSTNYFIEKVLKDSFEATAYVKTA